MSISLREFLKHILDECNYILSVSHDITYGQFLENETLKRSISRSIEIIGEASKKFDDEFRAKYPEVEWSKMARTRDLITHHYFGIDYDIIWQIVTDKIPPLKDHIEDILVDLDKT